MSASPHLRCRRFGVTSFTSDEFILGHGGVEQVYWSEAHGACIYHQQHKEYYRIVEGSQLNELSSNVDDIAGHLRQMMRSLETKIQELEARSNARFDKLDSNFDERVIQIYEYAHSQTAALKEGLHEKGVQMAAIRQDLEAFPVFVNDSMSKVNKRLDEVCINDSIAKVNKRLDEVERRAEDAVSHLKGAKASADSNIELESARGLELDSIRGLVESKIDAEYVESKLQSLSDEFTGKIQSHNQGLLNAMRQTVQLSSLEMLRRVKEFEKNILQTCGFDFDDFDGGPGSPANESPRPRRFSSPPANNNRPSTHQPSSNRPARDIHRLERPSSQQPLKFSGQPSPMPPRGQSATPTGVSPTGQQPSPLPQRGQSATPTGGANLMAREWNNAPPTMSRSDVARIGQRRLRAVVSVAGLKPPAKR